MTHVVAVMVVAGTARAISGATRAGAGAEIGMSVVPVNLLIIDVETAAFVHQSLGGAAVMVVGSTARTTAGLALGTRGTIVLTLAPLMGLDIPTVRDGRYGKGMLKT